MDLTSASVFNGYSSTANGSPSAVELLESIPEAAIQEARVIVKEMKQLEDSNTLYYKCLSMLQLGGLEAEIPRLVVFGQQSMGKTTLLDFIMGGPIGYSSTDTGTRQPVVIMLNPSNKDTIECVFKNQKMGIKELQDAMAEHMKTFGETISEKELKVEISVPGGVYAAFVDLPGIKDDSKVGSVFTRSVVRNYVKHNPNDLYILVKKSSDDPANWPWSLREFILSAAPRGLGLTRSQTVVVGTRAKEFLQSEKNDIRTQQDLLSRVTKRAVTDPSGEPFPLYLLELYSLDAQIKANGDFQEQKEEMHEQIRDGQVAILDLLMNSYEPIGDVNNRKRLFNYFDAYQFKNELNTKFRNLLGTQLGVLERRLQKKRTDVKQKLRELEERRTNFTAGACREHIKLFLRELLQIVSELMTGNYVVMKLPDHGKNFLAEHGGSLLDNLKEGNQLAVELFPNNAHYKPDVAEELIKSTEDGDDSESQSMKAETNEWEHGQIIRFRLPKNDITLLGIVEGISNEANSSGADIVKFSDESPSETVTVTFYVEKKQAEEIVRTEHRKIVNGERLNILKQIPTSGIKKLGPVITCWHRFVRSDGWIGLNAATVTEKEIAEANDDKDSVNINYIDEKDSEEGTTEHTAILKDLYVDASMLLAAGSEASKGSFYKKRSVATHYAETKLLNQFSLTSLATWMQSKLTSMEPEQRFSEQILLQMMRSVHHVIDKIEWQPLIADILQANISDGMLNLAKLVSCSAAVALRRTIKAACAELKRHVTSGGASNSLAFLVENDKFMTELDDTIDEYCRLKAASCITTMETAIFEQTYAIRFEVVEELFEGCCEYEEKFLRSSKLRDVVQSLREHLWKREKVLAAEGLLNLKDEKSCNLIYNEVFMQFWVAKMLLSAPLATKIYIHFIRSVVDKSNHLASRKNAKILCESELEDYLQMKLLCSASENDAYVPRTDAELLEYYELASEISEQERMRTQYADVEEYIRTAQEGVSKLKNQMHRQGGVDFLMRLSGQDKTKEAANGMNGYFGSMAAAASGPTNVDNDVII